MGAALEGEKIRLELILWDGSETKYPRARLFDRAGLELTGSPVSLVHLDDGLYVNEDITMPDEDVTVLYRVFDDMAFTTVSDDHADSCELISLVIANQEITDKLDQIIDLINKLRGDADEFIQGQIGDDLDLIGKIAEETKSLIGSLSRDEDLIGVTGEDGPVIGFVDNGQTLVGVALECA